MVNKSDYQIRESGDPMAPWELIAPDGRTVSVCETKREARGMIVGDIAEQVHAGNPYYRKGEGS